jgi:DNA repair protein RadC
MNFAATVDQTTTSENAIIQNAIQILESLIQLPSDFLTSPDNTRQFLRLKLSHLEHEVFAVLFLDSRNGVIQYIEMFTGTIDAASVYPREVVKAALRYNAAAVIFAHNHPSGTSVPSESDKRITKRLKEALSLVDIRVLDHLIVGTEISSFSEQGLL